MNQTCASHTVCILTVVFIFWITQIGVRWRRARWHFIVCKVVILIIITFWATWRLAFLWNLCIISTSCKQSHQKFKINDWCNLFHNNVMKERVTCMTISEGTPVKQGHSQYRVNQGTCLSQLFRFVSYLLWTGKVKKLLNTYMKGILTMDITSVIIGFFLPTALSRVSMLNPEILVKIKELSIWCNTVTLWFPTGWPSLGLLEQISPLQLKIYQLVEIWQFGRTYQSFLLCQFWNETGSFWKDHFADS